MATSTMVPLEEYLHTDYKPDCEWVDGELKERSVGEGSHGNIQTFSSSILRLANSSGGFVLRRRCGPSSLPGTTGFRM